MKPQNMESLKKPDTSRNTYWCCKTSNATKNTSCSSCAAETTPTLDRDDRALRYHIVSFGKRADAIPACEKSHRNLLGVAIQDFRNRPGPCALRAGVDPNFAILIKDADGTIRSTITPTNLQNQIVASGDLVTDFQNAAVILLGSDPDTGNVKKKR